MGIKIGILKIYRKIVEQIQKKFGYPSLPSCIFTLIFALIRSVTTEGELLILLFEKFCQSAIEKVHNFFIHHTMIHIPLFPV